MATDNDLQQRVQKIGEMVGEIESIADPNTRAIVQELLESLMALHGAGLERILKIVSAAGVAGDAVFRNCAQDELVSSLLLLYGLHPDDLPTRVTRALEKSRNNLGKQSASAELISISDEGDVRVRLRIKSAGCGSSATSVKVALEATLQNAAPDAVSIAVELVESDLAPSAFVSVAQLQNCQDIISLSRPRAERSGD